LQEEPLSQQRGQPLHHSVPYQKKKKREKMKKQGEEVLNYSLQEEVLSPQQELLLHPGVPEKSYLPSAQQLLEKEEKHSNLQDK
jgi:DNA repair protein RadC